MGSSERLHSSSVFLVGQHWPGARSARRFCAPVGKERRTRRSMVSPSLSIRPLVTSPKDSARVSSMTNGWPNLSAAAVPQLQATPITGDRPTVDQRAVGAFATPADYRAGRWWDSPQLRSWPFGVELRCEALHWSGRETRLPCTWWCSMDPGEPPSIRVERGLLWSKHYHQRSIATRADCGWWPILGALCHSRCRAGHPVCRRRGHSGPHVDPIGARRRRIVPHGGCGLRPL